MGKKKKDKNPAGGDSTEITKKVSELQIGDASTSQNVEKPEPPPPAEEEEADCGLGLGGGGGKKRKPRKKPAQASTTKLPAESQISEPIPSMQPGVGKVPMGPPGVEPFPGLLGPSGHQGQMIQQQHYMPGQMIQQPHYMPGQPGLPAYPGPMPGQPGYRGPQPGQPGYMGPFPSQQGYVEPMGPPRVGPFPGLPGPSGHPGQMIQQPHYMPRQPGPPGYHGPMPGQPGYKGPMPPVPPGQMGPMPVQPGQMGPMPVPPGQMGPMPVPPGQMGPMPVPPGQMGPMSVPPGQMRPMPGPPGNMGQLPSGMGPFPGQANPTGLQQPPVVSPPSPLEAKPEVPATADPTPSQVPKKSRRGRKGPTPEKTTSTQDLPQVESSTSISSQASGDASVRTVARCIPQKIPGNSVSMMPYPVITNYLSMTIKAIKIHRYDVTIVPDRPKKYLGRVFSTAMKQVFPGHIAAYDQMKNCYCVKPFPNVTKARVADKVEIQDDNGKVMKFEISLKSTGIVDLGTILEYMKSGSSLAPPTEAIQCIDVVLRQGTLESYVKAGRQFFKRPSKPIELGDGMEMWTGLFQSAIFTSKAFINIDVAHKGFPICQPLINLVTSMRLDPRKSLKDQYGRGLDNFKSFIKGLKVTAYVGAKGKATKREFIVNDIAEPPHKITFDYTDEKGNKRPMTVADYFNKIKQTPLKYPNLNCLWVGPRDKKIFYPLELLDVAYGQVRNRQLNDIQLSNMVREAATPPDQRKKKIEEVIANMNYTNNAFFKQFGLEISNQFTPVQGKLIPAPKLDCGGQTALPAKGQWKADKLLEGRTLDSWGIIGVELDPNASNADQICSLFQSVGRQMGMQVARPCLFEFNVQSRGGRLEGVMRDAFARKLQLLLVVINTRSKDLYSQVKKMAECNVGVLTQCLKDQTASRRMNPQTARNILLKVNSKLMGVNQALSLATMPACLRSGPFMVVGADVTHPSPEQSNIPSIAAVTASIDKKCFKYNIEFSIQTPKKEVIVEFEDMMVDHFLLFKKQLNCLPKKIYVFRDGVSEGQFAEVMQSELQAVYNAYRRVSNQPDKPQVLFMLVQKRHHTRFFLPRSPANVEPGTVVDQDIVHPRELDFYLVSHQAIKGTARPTRYHAICNDSALKDDEVEQLAFYLCHLYARCTRSVSYPTPTYYAHLACMRARALTLNENFDNAQLERQPKRLHIKQHLHDISPMFFV